MKKLTLNRGSGAYRYYRACLETWEEFKDVPHRLRSKPDAGKGDNLCRIVRTMTVVPATMLGSNLLAVGLAVTCGGVIPCQWFGWWPYLRGVLWVAAVVALIVGIVLLWTLIGDWVRERRRSQPFDYDEYYSRPEKVGAFKKLAQAYMKSKLHDKICPFVEFEGGEVAK